MLGNDTDVEGDSLTVVGSTARPPTSAPSHAGLGRDVTLNANGSFTLRPERPFETSTRRDRHRQLHLPRQRRRPRSNVATVTITINGVNDAPVAVDDTLPTDEDTTLIVAAPGVLGNDTDVEGDSLTVDASTAGVGTSTRPRRT